MDDTLLAAPPIAGRTAPHRHWAAIAIIFLCSAAAVLPLAIRGASCGHDFDFHLLSWLEAAQDWHQGLYAPHWLATANYGAGEPRFVFYPPLSWLLGAAAGSLAGWTLAPVLVTFLGIFAAGVCVYRLTVTLVNRSAALSATCLFLANPYLLFVAFERTAYGELLATGPMALLLLFALRKKIPVASMAWVVAALWLTNAPAAVMGCYTLALIAALRLLLERSGWVALRAAAGCALGSGLAGFYLVPAAREQRWVQIARAVGPGMRIQDSFLFEHTGAAFHDQVLHTASVLAVVVFTIAAVAAAGIWLRERKHAAFAILWPLVLAIFLLQFPFSAWLWRAAPHLAFLQFPWRWLLVATLATACMVALALPRSSARQDAWQRRVSRLQMGAALVIAGVSVWTCSHNFYQPCDEEDAIGGQLGVFHDGTGVEGTDEYTSGSADNSRVQQHLPAVRLLTRAYGNEASPSADENPEWTAADTLSGTVQISAWTAESKLVTVQALQPGYAVLRLMDYPAWQVKVDGHVLGDRPVRGDGLMAVPVPAGTSKIAVRWSTTKDVLWGRVCSVAAVMILTGMRIFRRIRKRNHHAEPALASLD